MNFKAFLKFIILWAVACLCAAKSVAQTEYEHPYHDYRAAYTVEGEYSIIYNNEAEFSKLKNFRLKFYDANGNLLTETETRTYPLGGRAQTYSLSDPVIGFSVIELSIISLYEGEKADFPTNIMNVLGLTLQEIKDDIVPEETKPDVTIPIELEIGESDEINEIRPSLTDAEIANLDRAEDKIDHLLRELNSTFMPLTTFADSQSNIAQQISDILLNTKELSRKAINAERTDLTSEIENLIETLSSAKDNAENNSGISEKLAELEALQAKLLGLKTQITELRNRRDLANADISGVLPALENTETKLEEITTRITTLTLPEHVTASNVSDFDARYTALDFQFNNPPVSTNWPGLFAALLAGLVLLGFAAKFLLPAKTKPRVLKSALNLAQHPGVTFPASPLLAGNIAAPLVPAGQLAAAQLQMLSGPYAILRDAYQAAGRIGYAQEGIPTPEDYAFGTGFLVSDRHVLTNRHVHGMYGHYMMDEADPGGIEFIAEKGKDASDFVPFNCEPPLLLPALDIAIYTLARPVVNRLPIKLKPVTTSTLEGRDIVVIGYPDTHTPEAEHIRAVVEEDAVFAVKRLSQGKIFRHSTDTDTPFGVETEVSEDKHSSFAMPAICHNASTMSGNSGSPLLDIKTGQLVGVHFAGFKVFNREEAANLAMAIAQLTGETSKEYLSGVTSITGIATNST